FFRHCCVHQAPLACEDSVWPVDPLHRSHLEGRCFLIAGSLSDPADLENFKRRDSAKSNFVNASETSKMSFTGIFGFGDSCQYVHSGVTLEGPSFTLQYNNLQKSCPDCMVIRFDSKSNELKHFYLFNRQKEVEKKEMEEFKAQVECLNMPPPVVMDPTKDFCQEQIAPQASR
uniref:Apolipoprotein M n=1 Tax=Cyclopterus lumpus TaxID=8103 RepID=A0A8C2XPI0_CYCLU